MSGMKIRFLTLIRELRAAGDDVTVITPDMGAPDDYHGARVWPYLQPRKKLASSISPIFYHHCTNDPVCRLQNTD